MEKFLESHNLTIKSPQSRETYLIQVSTSWCEKVETLEVYCLYDVLRVMKYYLYPYENLWYDVNVERL